MDRNLLFTREGAHSRNRILHAHGDSTGREIARTLYRKAASHPNIHFAASRSITDLAGRRRRGRGRAWLYDAKLRGDGPDRRRAPCCWPPAGWAACF